MGFQITEQGLRTLGSGTVDSGGGNSPAAAVPAAVAIAKAKEIADVLRERFEQQGWIQ